MKWLLLAACLAAAPEVDQAEVSRLGDSVSVVGEGPRSDAGFDNFQAAMAPPNADAEKWFISIVSSRGCQPCAQLKADWQRSVDLLALANPADAPHSWAHFNIYDKDDRSQQFRWQALRVTSYPTIIVQPPRSGRFGPPPTVVFQRAGYAGDARGLADGIKAAVREYVEKLPAVQGPYRQEAATENSNGIDPPWQPTPRNDPFAPSPQPYYPQPYGPQPFGPQPGFDPVIPPQRQPSLTEGVPLSMLLTWGFNIGLAMVLLVVGFLVFRPGRQGAAAILILAALASSADAAPFSRTPEQPPPAAIAVDEATMPQPITDDEPRPLYAESALDAAAEGPVARVRVFITVTNIAHPTSREVEAEFRKQLAKAGWLIVRRAPGSRVPERQAHFIFLPAAGEWFSGYVIEQDGEVVARELGIPDPIQIATRVKRLTETGEDELPEEAEPVRKSTSASCSDGSCSPRMTHSRRIRRRW